jgi:ATP-binding cassette subfamily F protein uup
LRLRPARGAGGQRGEAAPPRASERGWGPASKERSRLVGPEQPEGRADGPRRKLSYNEQRELEALPAHIEALEAEQQRLRQESESPDFYKEGADHIRAVLARIEQAGVELEAALARWVELEGRT